VDPTKASQTAIGTALMRAAHTRLDRPLLINDPWGDRLILDPERANMLKLAGLDELDTALRAHPSYGTVILRARYAEDALTEAVAKGITQYVIVGAGLDSFALRDPPFARALEVFEVDHPATQTFKIKRLADRGIKLSPRLHFVPADLSEVQLDAALADSPYRSHKSAFFSWLGVTPYLSRDANLATLRAIAACGPSASELVFSYTDQSIFESEHADPDGLLAAGATLASAGEPWVSGFHPHELASDLRACGLELVEDLGPEDLNARYCTGRDDGLSASPKAHAAHARTAT
jgi:methyltransferase (TIGR00027 family)